MNGFPDTTPASPGFEDHFGEPALPRPRPDSAYPRSRVKAPSVTQQSPGDGFGVGLDTAADSSTSITVSRPCHGPRGSAKSR